MKKTLSLVLALALVLSLVGSVSFASAEGEGYKYSYTVTPYDTGTPYNDPTSTDLDLKVYKAIFDKYDIYLDFVFVEDKATQLPLLAASGELPDFFINGSYSQSFLDQGILGTWDEEWYRTVAPINSAYVDEYGPGSWALTKDSEGMMYMLPGINAEYMYPNVVAWNQDYLTALGYDSVPEDLDEMEEIFYAIAQKDPDGNGINDTYAFSNTGLNVIYGAYGFQRGYWVADENGDVVYGDVMPKAKDALARLAKYYADGVLDPEFISGENEGGYWAVSHSFVKGRIGMSNMGCWYHWTYAPEYETYASNPAEVQKLENPFEISFSKPAKGTYGDQKIGCNGGDDCRMNFSYELVEDTEKFAYLLNFIDNACADQETYAMQWFGIEGEDFEYQQMGDLSVPKGFPVNVDDTREKVNEVPSNAFNFNVGAPDMQKFKNQIGFGWVEDLQGEWYRDVTLVNAVKETLPSAIDYKTECDKILAEGYIAIITGEKDIEYFDEMVEAWYSAGGTQMTADANEIYHSK